VNDIHRQIKALKASTIMIVDDEPTTIDVLQVFLEGEGYTSFVTTTDSRQALDLLEDERPDILLLDLMMPNVSGLEILSAIRNHAALECTPVIVLTSSTDAETKLEALELGATDFLGKPVDPSELALRLRNTLAAKAYQDQLAYQGSPAGLPNGQLFMERLDRALQRAGPPLVSRLASNPRLRSTIEKFARRLEEKLEAMEASWEAGDFEELARLAHWLKGAAGMVGFDAFSGPAESLELLAKKKKEGEIEAAIRELRGLARRIAVETDHHT
jgi:DNA-binding response OmpR family regulator